MKKNDMVRTPSTETRVRFQDCDPFGHLNNARYLDYFINAREDHLADTCGLDIYDRQRRHGTNWVIAKTKIAYLNPAVFREYIEISTRLLDYSRNTILMEGQMTGLEKKDLKAVVWIEFRHFDLAAKKSVPHDHCLMDLFEMIALPTSGREDFDERVRTIFRRSLKN